MKLVYNVKDKPPFARTLVFAFQQMLAILAATIAVPAIIGNGMSQSAALFGAGMGTLVYLLFTKFKSPVFLGSSFAFIASMFAAFGGAASAAAGYLGIIMGAVMAGLVYVIIAIVVKIFGVKWVEKCMPAVVIGPTVAIIGLSLAGNAVGDLFKGGVTYMQSYPTWAEVNGKWTTVLESTPVPYANQYIALLCGLITLGVTIACSVYGKKMVKMIPFILGILAGYVTATIFTVIGHVANIDAFLVVDFAKFKSMQWYPDFAFLQIFKGGLNFGEGGFGAYLLTIAAAYVPVAFVVFAEHIADHKNISSIIESDLLEDPGLDRTLLGDGVGSMVGAFFGGCPNTTYGESVGCVAISGNASVVTILTTAIMAIVASFVAPFVTFLATIPSCVMGGVCMALYGFIAVSGLKMVQKVDLEDNRNLFVVSVILISGIGGMVLSFGSVQITSIACALILGMLTNVLVHAKKAPTVEEASAVNATEELAEVEDLEKESSEDAE